MKISNRQAEALPSNLTTDQLGKAMSQLDLSSIPQTSDKLPSWIT